MAKLFGAQQLVLQAVVDLANDAAAFVSDARIAETTHIAVDDVRDWIETLEDDRLVDVARSEDSLNVSITAQGRLALGQHRPIQPAPARTLQDQQPVSASLELLILGAMWELQSSDNEVNQATAELVARKTGVDKNDVNEGLLSLCNKGLILLTFARQTGTLVAKLRQKGVDLISDYNRLQIKKRLKEHRRRPPVRDGVIVDLEAEKQYSMFTKRDLDRLLRSIKSTFHLSGRNLRILRVSPKYLVVRSGNTEIRLETTPAAAKSLIERTDIHGLYLTYDIIKITHAVLRRSFTDFAFDLIDASAEFIIKIIKKIGRAIVSFVTSIFLGVFGTTAGGEHRFLNSIGFIIYMLIVLSVIVIALGATGIIKLPW
jgi:hypothetical protein